MKPIAIITGFLGSGKTTLLNRLLRHPDMAATAVLVNEFGEVGVDNLIVDQLDEDVVLLESGCVCCDVRDDLTASLLALHQRGSRGELPPFEQVVLETTGIADPAAILQLLMADEFVCAHYAIGNVVTVVDACFATINLDTVPEAARQVMLAERLVIAKTDLVATSTVSAVRRKLTELNPAATILSVEHASPQALFATGAGSKSPLTLPALADHGRRYSTFQVGWNEPVEWSRISTWIEGLLGARGSDIWRIKGLLHICGEQRPIVFHTVQHSVYAPDHLEAWPAPGPRSDLTFITQHFSQQAALTSLRPYVDV